MKQQLNEVKRLQELAGISDQPKASFQGKFKDVKDQRAFIEKFHLEPDNPLTMTVSSYIGDYYNFAITNENGKFKVYKFRRMAELGNPVGTFNSVEDAKKEIQKLDI